MAYVPTIRKVDRALTDARRSLNRALEAHRLTEAADYQARIDNLLDQRLELANG